MKASQKVKQFIKGHEGLRLKAYLCPAGVWTIGYGHTKNVKKGMTIDESKADEFFDLDIEIAEKVVIKLIGKDLMPYVLQGEFDAMVSFVYNFGEVKTKRYTILKKWKEWFNARKILSSEEVIRYWFNQYIKGGGKDLPGLIKRRSKEADIYFSK